MSASLNILSGKRSSPGPTRWRFRCANPNASIIRRGGASSVRLMATKSLLEAKPFLMSWRFHRTFGKRKPRLFLCARRRKPPISRNRRDRRYSQAGSGPGSGWLSNMGLRTVLLTGDNKDVGQSVATQLAVDEVQAELLPVQKLERVQQLITGDGVVVMVGDGINDAPALMQPAWASLWDPEQTLPGRPQTSSC